MGFKATGVALKMNRVDASLLGRLVALNSHRLADILKASGLIKKRMNKFSITKQGEYLVKNNKIKELFDILILVFFNKLNWSAFDYYVEIPTIQCSAIFNIYVLNKKAKDWISSKELGKIFLKAFPDIAYDLNTKYSCFDPKTEIVNCFNIRFLERVCLLWGLLERKKEAKGLQTIKYYRLSPFFKQHLKFKNEINLS